MDKMALRDQAQMFFVGVVPFLPHYDKPNVYVAPDNSEWSADELSKRGGKPVNTFLWPRHWQQKQLRASGFKERSIKPAPSGFKAPEKPSHEILLDFLKSDGSPMTVSDMARDLHWSTGRTRDALAYLRQASKVVEWGKKQNVNDPQRWVVK